MWIIFTVNVAYCRLRERQRESDMVSVSRVHIATHSYAVVGSKDVVCVCVCKMNISCTHYIHYKYYCIHFYIILTELFSLFSFIYRCPCLGRREWCFKVCKSLRHNSKMSLKIIYFAYLSDISFFFCVPIHTHAAFQKKPEKCEIPTSNKENLLP